MGDFLKVVSNLNIDILNGILVSDFGVVAEDGKKPFICRHTGKGEAGGENASVGVHPDECCCFKKPSDSSFAK